MKVSLSLLIQQLISANSMHFKRAEKLLWTVFYPLTSIIILLTVQTSSFADSNKEYSIKAGFILNFLKFIDLNQGPEDITICISNENNVHKSFEILNGQKVKESQVSVISLTSPVLKPECNIIFIAFSDNDDSNDLLKQATQQSVLTIGETEDFIKEGGVIRFFTEDNKIRFAVNLNAARKCSVNISAQLLKLAKIENY